jgi:hypothetical protein
VSSMLTYDLATTLVLVAVVGHGERDDHRRVGVDVAARAGSAALIVDTSGGPIVIHC